MDILTSVHHYVKVLMMIDKVEAKDKPEIHKEIGFLGLVYSSLVKVSNVPRGGITDKNYLKVLKHVLGHN